MSNYPAGMSRDDLIHVGAIDDPDEPPEWFDELVNDDWMNAQISSGTNTGATSKPSTTTSASKAQPNGSTSTTPQLSTKTAALRHR